MCAELQKTQTTSSIFHTGGYGGVIHEQTELSDHCWGQYAHNNQPVHYMLYMHMYDGYSGPCSTQGRYWIRKALTALYRPDASMFPGDEDNGEMGAWFVLSSIGLYNRSPGSPDFELGIPLFGEVEIDISDSSYDISDQNITKSNKKTLKIVAINNTPENVHVQRILWEGKELIKSANSISYALLSQGGTLTFEMGPILK